MAIAKSLRYKDTSKNREEANTTGVKESERTCGER